VLCTGTVRGAGTAVVRIIDAPTQVIARSAALPWPPLVPRTALYGTSGYKGLYCEDYGGVLGASRSFLANGDLIKNTATVRSGGATSSIEVVPQSWCDSTHPIPILEWTEHDVPASAQTRGVYILGGGWSTFPTAALLWFEAEYLDAASGLTKTVVASTAVLTDNVTWTKFSVTFTPGQVGIVRYKAFLGDYDSGASVFVGDSVSDLLPLLAVSRGVHVATDGHIHKGLGVC
jgi:hypothetical protein